MTKQPLLVSKNRISNEISFKNQTMYLRIFFSQWPQRVWLGTNSVPISGLFANNFFVAIKSFVYLFCLPNTMFFVNKVIKNIAHSCYRYAPYYNVQSTVYLYLHLYRCHWQTLRGTSRPQPPHPHSLLELNITYVVDKNNVANLISKRVLWVRILMNAGIWHRRVKQNRFNVPLKYTETLILKVLCLFATFPRI